MPNLRCGFLLLKNRYNIAKEFLHQKKNKCSGKFLTVFPYIASTLSDILHSNRNYRFFAITVNSQSLFFHTGVDVFYEGGRKMRNKALDCLALTIAIIGAINWGLIGFFSFDLVAFIFGNMSWFSRIIYALVGIAGLYIITFYMYTNGTAESNKA